MQKIMASKNKVFQEIIEEIIKSQIEKDTKEDFSSEISENVDDEVLNSYEKEKNEKTTKEESVNDSADHHNLKNDVTLTKPLVSDSITNELFRKRGIQNLEERYKLLNILKNFFMLQLIIMNLVVLLLVAWTIFDIGLFNDIDKDLFKSISVFIQFYISVVLVELLGGIIYIVHKVFSEKFSDNLPKK